MVAFNKNMLVHYHSLELCLQDCLRHLTERPRVLLCGALFTFVVVYLAVTMIDRFRKPLFRRIDSPDPEKPKIRNSSSLREPERSPGTWVPVEFERPATLPYPGWDVHKTKPLPYRPCKHGPYHITMGLRTMKWDEWIELDNHYSKFHADKARRIEDRGSKCSKTAPEAFDGAVELLEEL